jgi:hypothetical protein
MKRVVSVSLGSSKRDHKVEVNLLGQKFSIERIGTDGDMQKAMELIRSLDGQVAAFGLGGIDLYIYAGTKRYVIKDAARIASIAQKTPVVDGSGLKNTLERKAITYLQETGINFQDVPVLLVCGVDRFGMAETLTQNGARLTCGDLIFALGLPIPLRSLKALNTLAKIIAPVIVKLPFKYLYPTGDKQEKISMKHSKYYDEAEIIAGDFHFIKKYMPPRLEGKIIITNTVTSQDIEMLKSRGVKTLITTTPKLNGRSFGTNVMEALLIALADKKSSLTPAEYNDLLDQICFKPTIQNL